MHHVLCHLLKPSQCRNYNYTHAPPNQKVNFTKEGAAKPQSTLAMFSNDFSRKLSLDSSYVRPIFDADSFWSAAVVGTAISRDLVQKAERWKLLAE